MVPKEDPMVQEIAEVLREWSLMWKKLYAVSMCVLSVCCVCVCVCVVCVLCVCDTELAM